MVDFVDPQFNSRCVLYGHHHPKIEGDIDIHSDIHTSTSTLCDDDTNTHE